MKTNKLFVALSMLLLIGSIAGCRGTGGKSPDIGDSLSKALTEAGLKDVTVSQDRDKGIVTLGGRVASEGEKTQAEAMANSFAAGQVVADQIAVIPAGAGNEVNAVNSDLDQGIEKNLDAALIQQKMHDSVKYAVKNGVITLSGEVSSEQVRTSAGQAAAGVPNVRQVVNALEVVKNRKASTTP
jgi:osmotically-inducible protein OsmY